VSRPDVLVAIPALNEAETIESVVGEVRLAVPEAVVVVVDDGSSDDTAARAGAAGAVVLRMPFNVGVGGAMRTAFLYAQENGFQRVVQVDADGQHDPREVPLLLDGLSDASVVVGSRFAGRGEYTARGPRRWAMVLLSLVMSKVTGTRLTDVTSGFRAADSRAIELFARHYPAEYLGDTVESLMIASRSGLAVHQVPVVMRPRQGGQASQGGRMATLYLGRAVLALFVALTRRRGVANS
jgi:glycosyltransferase involved in cell wall biosynthesis